MFMNEGVPESSEVREHAKRCEKESAARILESRVRYRLRNGRLRLHKTRGERQRLLLGRYWVTDSLGVMPILRDVDLKDLARRLRIWCGDLGID
jgi:hypothetical protein